jgi:toluene monooxygenase electron transfer component
MNTAATWRAVAVSFSGVDTVVDCGPDETILLAGLRAGLALPYECASGGCGTCRAQLVEGSVTSRWHEATGLSARDRRKGDRILMCQSVPQGGRCQVRMPICDAPFPPGEPSPGRFAGLLTERELLTSDTARFVIDVGHDLTYLPGQFVLVEFADGVRRAYSMSRPVHCEQRGALELLIRAKPGGAASSWLFGRLETGAEFVVEGPYGKAYAQSPPRRPVVCLAGGTGLAPVLAIAQQLASDSPGRPIDVYVGARTAADVVLAERLAALANSGARVICAVEQDPGTGHPRLGPLRTGLALDHLASDWPDLSQHDVYVAGPEPMIDATLRRLVRNGTANADRIFYDRFIS